MQMSGLVQKVSLITVIYWMLWLLLTIAVILWPTHLSTVSVYVLVCAAGSGRQEYPGDGPSSTLCPTALNSPTGIDSHFPSAFLFKAVVLDHLAADEARQPALWFGPFSFCFILKSTWNEVAFFVSYRIHICELYKSPFLWEKTETKRERFIF